MAPTWDTFGDIPNPPLESAAAVVILAYASTGGERASGDDGPRDIVNASAYLELWDEELGVQAADLGLRTLPEPLIVDLSDPAPLVEALEAAHRAGAFPIIIGNDRRLSASAARACRAVVPLVHHLVVSGSIPVCAGERGSLSVAGLKSPPVKVRPGIDVLPTARRLMADPPLDPWEEIGPPVHLSVCPDVLEPAVLPAPYNLEPGGLDWWRLQDVLRSLFATRRVISMDLSGHRGSGGRAIVDFTLAKLLYKAAGYRLCLREAGGCR